MAKGLDLGMFAHLTKKDAMPRARFQADLYVSIFKKRGTKLRAFARRLACNEEELLGIVKGYERQLAQHVDDDGLVTWEGFQLFYGLLRSARSGSGTPVTPATPPRGEPR